MTQEQVMDLVKELEDRQEAFEAVSGYLFGEQAAAARGAAGAYQEIGRLLRAYL